MKMLKFFFFSVLFLYSITGNAQTYFAPVGAVWHYKIGSIFTYDGGYAQLTVAKDTIINGKKCAVIKSKQYYKPNQQYDLDSVFILTQDSLKVEYFTNGKFTTLYDFGAKEGDSWTIEEEFKINTATVIADDSININGRNHKRLVVNYSNHPKQDTIIERIGGMVSFIPIFSTKEIRFAFQGLNCYSDSFLSYNHIDGPCETMYFLGIEENRDVVNKTFKVHPNPFIENCIVEYNLDYAASVEINLYDINGQSQLLMSSDMSPAGKHQFILDAYKYKIGKGIYILKVNVDGIPTYKRLVKINK